MTDILADFVVILFVGLSGLIVLYTLACWLFPPTDCDCGPVLPCAKHNEEMCEIDNEWEEMGK